MVTHTKTETHEDRAWRLALEASDKKAPEYKREHAAEELFEHMSKMPEASKKRLVAALRSLTYQPALEGIIP